MIRYIEDAPDPHTPILSCDNCWEAVCVLCEEAHPNEDLFLPCTGED